MHRCVHFHSSFISRVFVGILWRHLDLESCPLGRVVSVMLMGVEVAVAVGVGDAGEDVDVGTWTWAAFEDV